MIKKYKKKDGSTAWKLVAYLGVDPVTGKQRRTTRQGFATKREAQAALRALELKGIPDKKPKHVKLADVYADWVEWYRPTVKPSTFRTVSTIYNARILPPLGEHYMDKITPAQVQKLLDPDRVLWSQKLLSCLRRLFRYAKKLGYIKEDPCEMVNAPRKSQNITIKKIKYLTPEQVRQLMQNIANYDQAPPITARDLAFYSVLVYGGLRIGEACALTWDDLDGNALSIHRTTARKKGGIYLSETPKTAASVRTIELDPTTVKKLRQWHKYQKELFNQPPQFIFTRFERPTYAPPQSWVYPLKVKYSDHLPPITPHALRHTHASMLFASGATMKDVQVRLGHSDITTTMNTYTHILPERKQTVAANFFRYLDENR